MSSVFRAGTVVIAVEGEEAAARRLAKAKATDVASYECEKDETDERDEPEQPFDNQSTCQRRSPNQYVTKRQETRTSCRRKGAWEMGLMGELGAVVGKKKKEARTSREGLDINVVSYKYEGMRQKEETSLVLGEAEVEVGTWELGLDDVFPEPVHRGAIGDVRRVGRTSATGKEGSELGFGTGDKGSRVPASGEWTGVVVVGVNCGFDGIEGADEAVAALMRLEPTKTTNRGERGETAFDHESHGVALQVLIVGLTYLSGGESASELEKAILGVVELGLCVVPRIH